MTPREYELAVLESRLLAFLVSIEGDEDEVSHRHARLRLTHPTEPSGPEI
jgi:hypothetical protein